MCAYVRCCVCLVEPVLTSSSCSCSFSCSCSVVCCQSSAVQNHLLLAEVRLPLEETTLDARRYDESGRTDVMSNAEAKDSKSQAEGYAYGGANGQFRLGVRTSAPFWRSSRPSSSALLRRRQSGDRSIDQSLGRSESRPIHASELQSHRHQIRRCVVSALYLLRLFVCSSPRAPLRLTLVRSQVRRCMCSIRRATLRSRRRTASANRT